jgi:hypothetical protein
MPGAWRGELVRARWSGALAAAVLWAGLGAGAPAAAATDAAAKYEKDLAALFAEVDQHYPFFDLKGIRRDWQAAKTRLAARAKTCPSDTEFLRIVVDALRCLRDGHARLHDARVPFPDYEREYHPGISFLPATRNRVAIMHPPGGHERQLRRGMVVTEIDGRDARTVLEERAKRAWSAGGFFSSPQRARVFEYRVALRGKKGEKHAVTCQVGDRKRTVTLASTMPVRGWPRMYNMPPELVRVGQSFWYAQLRSGAGYMYLRRVDGSIVRGIARALRSLPVAQGWVVDLRGNSGGGYSGELIKAMREFPRPVAVILDAGCISAGETLARDFARYSGARLFGSRSAGSSTIKRHLKLPSGLATVTFSVRSRTRRDRKPIEYNGIEPHEVVEADPDEVARGLNSAILRAEEYLRSRRISATRPATRPASGPATAPAGRRGGP